MEKKRGRVYVDVVIKQLNKNHLGNMVKGGGVTSSLSHQSYVKLFNDDICITCLLIYLRSQFHSNLESLTRLYLWDIVQYFT